ncbi:MAG: ABC transporter substrate-binding protein [Sulfobacillus acidophilus]|uniref:ABC transporter substrate-binding protein n=1 Tax=Sulfobacillus acidophilus TaxID=53633 RepID=A0A2T2WPC5_9FIRM|nr:MAG: ABC transporter substrate-binding protein [Sulfobacillus acidophilus]
MLSKSRISPTIRRTLDVVSQFSKGETFMKARRVAMAGGLALSLIALMGAAKTSNVNATSKAVAGGTIDYALPPATNLTWYFPLVNSSNDTVYNFQLIDQLYMPLLYINHDLGIDWKNSDATRVTYNSQGTIYHVFMNKKLKWSDGRPVTSADVLWDWKMIQATSAKNAPAPWPYEGAGTGDIPTGVKSVVPNGPYEFTVTLKSPANQQWFMYNGLNQLQPLPMQVWNKYPNNTLKEIQYLGAQATNPAFDSVVDGPYRLGKVVSSQYWTLVPNAKYTGGPLADSKIIMEYEGSNASEFAALKTGSIQVGYVDLSEYGAIGELKPIDNIWAGYNFGNFFLALNLHSNAENGLGPVFNQLYIRQAMEDAIDQNAINQDVYHGYAPDQYGPIPSIPSTQYLDPALKKPLYSYNPSAAKKLLTSHGWKDVNGVMTKGSQALKFTVLYTSGSQSITDMMVVIQSDLAKVGIKITLDPQPFATLVGTITNSADEGQWDAASGIGISYGGTYPTGQTEFATDGGLNFYGYNSSEEDKLIAATTKPTPSESQTLKIFDQYEYYTSQQLPLLFINNAGTIEAVQKDVHDVTTATLNPVTDVPLMQYWSVSK